MAEGTHLIISEVAVGVGSASNEFIEIYNPTASKINLRESGMKLRLVSSSGSITTKQITWIKEVIGPGDYFLFGTGSIEKSFDAVYSSASLTGVGGVIIADKNNNIIDGLSWGEKLPRTKNPPVLREGFRGFEIDQPGGLKTGQSVERKSSLNELDNNIDFILQNNPNPQNSALEAPEEESYDVEIKTDDKIYNNVYANFEIIGLPKDTEVTWVFGDGHRSYLQKTKHKYEQLGRYDASLKYSEGGKDVIKNFTINVAEVPHPEIRIVSVNANPKGSDSENETITIQNKSKKKINLKGWSIATGWKNLVNHPIRVDFEIKAKKKKEITREFSKFTLNNKKSKIEVRYPDGKVADDVKYKKKNETIAEGEVYERGKKRWKWIDNEKETRNKKQSIQNSSSKQSLVIVIQNDVVENESADIPNDEIEVRDFHYKNIELLRYEPISEMLESEPRIWNPDEIKESDGSYYFTPKNSEQHYAAIFAKNIFSGINAELNALLDYLRN